MVYDLSQEYHRRQAKARLERLLERRAVIDLTERKIRSIPQNRYLHACLGGLALHLGEKFEDVKKYIFKIKINPDIFIIDKTIKHAGKVKDLRSSSSLTKEEMSLAIERLRNWASKEEGYYIPSSEEHLLIRQMEIEIERAKVFLLQNK